MKNKKFLAISALFLCFILISTAISSELCDCFGSCITLYNRDLNQTTKNYIKKRDGYSAKKNIEIDHKIPLCLGGSNSLSNLQALTQAIHRKKTKNDMNLLNYVKSCNLTVLEAYEKAKKYKPN
jgi:hypothetical protein